MNEVNIIGLTGPTGSGKSTVCKVFENKGFHIINADIISREVVEKGKPCLDELAREFSQDILNPDKTLNRKQLAAIVFNDKGKLERLGQIIYPYITYQIIELIKELSTQGVNLALLDAPTLFESRADDLCKLVVCVNASKQQRLERIIKRDGITLEQAHERMNSQADFEYYSSRSDMIIENSGSLSELMEMAAHTASKIWEFYNDKNGTT